MIDFEEELKKFHPSLEVEDVEDTVMNQDVTDLADVLVNLVKESKEIATQGEHAQKEQSMEKQTASEPVLRLSPLDRKFMEQINNHVCENLADPELDVQFLADKMCMSYSTLYRKCKSILGISMLEYIRGIRLAKAKEMIQGDEMSIS